MVGADTPHAHSVSTRRAVSSKQHHDLGLDARMFAAREQRIHPASNRLGRFFAKTGAAASDGNDGVIVKYDEIIIRFSFTPCWLQSKADKAIVIEFLW
jgi:hypothetical protein